MKLHMHPLLHIKDGNIEKTVNEFGELHSIGDKPALVSKFSNGQLRTQAHYKHGKLHREGDKPAKLTYYSAFDMPTTNKKVTEEYYKHGKLHREGDKPAFLTYYPNGKIEQRNHYKHGELHREGDKPALRHNYNSTGNEYLEGYYKRGKLHREKDKPTSIRYRNGKVVSTY